MKQRMVMIAALSAGLLLAACASSPEQTTEDILSKRGYAVAGRTVGEPTLADLHSARAGHQPRLRNTRASCARSSSKETVGQWWQR